MNIFSALNGLPIERFFLEGYPMFMIFDSIANALEHLCCVDNWEWEGSSSYDGLCEWAYENAREETYLSECENPKTDKRWIYQIVSDYLKSVGENPSDYPLFSHSID